MPGDDYGKQIFIDRLHRYRFLSSTLGRFIQPDSIIPDLTNSQSLNRYSYTNNNPINFVDPTGHYMEQACGFGGGDCGTTDVETISLSPIPSIMRTGSDPWIENQSIEPLMQQLDPSGTLPPPMSIPLHEDNTPEEYGPETDFEGILIFGQHVGLNFVNQIGEGIDAINAAKLIRGGWKMGRASIPFGFAVEGGISAVLQFIIDSYDPNITYAQSFGRSLAIGIETGITDIGANFVGGLLVTPMAGVGSAVPGVGTAIGGFTGFQIGSIGTTLMADRAFGKFNSWLFPNIGLGEYP